MRKATFEEDATKNVLRSNREKKVIKAKNRATISNKLFWDREDLNFAEST